MSIFKKIIFILAITVSSLYLFTTISFAQSKIFTLEELAQFNGKDGAKSYTAYEGIVYDVTDSTLWKMGEHFGLQAGIDLTDKMKDAPHGAEVLKGFTVVGSLSERTDLVGEPVSFDDITAKQMEKDIPETKWYEKRIKVLGFSILGLTGIILGIFFVLTFATCFALPWAKLPLPWKGKKIGADPLDAAGTHMTWSSVHKYFVWVTVILGIVHGIIGFLQMLGIYL